MSVAGGLAALLLLLAGLAAGPPLEAQAASRNEAEEARMRLAQAEGLYGAGDYERCQSLLEGYSAEKHSGSFPYPRQVMARIYVLRALVAYAVRAEGEGYKQEVRGYLWEALEQFPDVELGNPSEVPLFVLDLFYQLRPEYLQAFDRLTRRHSLGLLFAVVVDPTVVQDLSRLQPGLYYSYNLSERLSLQTDLRFPLTLPIWDSIRGQIGLTWYPYFAAGKLSPSIATAYVFSLDNLRTYTHSISLSGQAEIVTRAGLGAGVRAEFVRVDLILGQVEAGDLPGYSSVAVGESFLRFTHANMTLFAFYTFGGGKR